MRGKGFSYHPRYFLLRITPAYAGKSSSLRRAETTAWDHPRVCGEKCPCAAKLSAQLGSPPRMRGKGFSYHPRYFLLRITPAYAGKSSSLRRAETTAWDHPRVCGEKRDFENQRAADRGSPPRMRGKGVRAGGVKVYRRITPAYAGKRLRPSRPAYTSRDHPRVCGEKSALRAAQVKLLGSPPRMRGKVPSGSYC